MPLVSQSGAAADKWDGALYLAGAGAGSLAVKGSAR